MLKGCLQSQTNCPTELLWLGFQMAFWQNRSMSLVDMYVDSSEPTETVGHIQFSLEYDFATSTLILKIIQVRKDLSTLFAEP